MSMNLPFANMTPLDRAQNGGDILLPDSFRQNLQLKSAALKDVGINTNQIPDMTNMTSFISANGWQKLPSGLIIQWGTTSCNIPAVAAGGNISGEAFANVTFTIAFPNAVLALSAFPAGDIGNANGETVRSGTPSKTSVPVTVGYVLPNPTTPALASVVPVSWIVLGY